jgi:hypothetical protein
VTCPKSQRAGLQLATLDDRAAPECLPGPASERWWSVPLSDVGVVERALFVDSTGAVGGARSSSSGHHHAAVAVLSHRR